MAAGGIATSARTEAGSCEFTLQRMAASLPLKLTRMLILNQSISFLENDTLF